MGKESPCSSIEARSHWQALAAIYITEMSAAISFLMALWSGFRALRWKKGVRRVVLLDLETWPLVWADGSFLKRCAAAPGIESVVFEIVIFISSTGNFNTITLDHISEGLKARKLTAPSLRVSFRLPCWSRCDRAGFGWRNCTFLVRYSRVISSIQVWCGDHLAGRVPGPRWTENPR